MRLPDGKTIASVTRPCQRPSEWCRREGSFRGPGWRRRRGCEAPDGRPVSKAPSRGRAGSGLCAERDGVVDSYFSGIGKIRYEGPESGNPLAFRWYDAERVVLGKRMADHLRFAVCYWHSFCATGDDPFGGATLVRPWMAPGDPLARAEVKLKAAFDFFAKLGVPFFCFHDRDLAPEGATLAESNANLARLEIGRAHV